MSSRWPGTGCTAGTPAVAVEHQACPSKQEVACSSGNLAAGFYIPRLVSEIAVECKSRTDSGGVFIGKLGPDVDSQLETFFNTCNKLRIVQFGGHGIQ